MKNVLLIVLFLFCGELVSAQKIRFSDTTNIWIESDFWPTGYFGSGIFYYGPDTISGGETYHLLKSSATAIAFIREDTVQKKVFAIALLDTNLTEQLLYDYNLNVGDTFRTRLTAHRVFHIDTVVINSVVHKVWSFALVKVIPYTTAHGYTVIEGIGSCYSPGDPLYPLNSGSKEFLTCFSNNGINPPLSHMIGPYFNNTTSCDSPYWIGVNDVQVAKQDLIVVPNPATNTISVKADLNLYHSIVICNAMGQQVVQQRLSIYETQIDVEGLPQGVYYVVLQGTEQREVSRFVKL